MTELQAYLIVSALLFGIGLAGVLLRRSAIIVLIGIELMLNAANLNLVAFWHYGADPANARGMMAVLFTMGVAAAEAAVGLALLITLYRHYRSVGLDQMQALAEPPT